MFVCLFVSLTYLNTSLCYRAEIYFWSAEENEVPKTVKSRLDPGPQLLYQGIAVVGMSLPGGLFLADGSSTQLSLFFPSVHAVDNK